MSLKAIQPSHKINAAVLGNEPNVGVKGLKSRARSESDALRVFENPQATLLTEGGNKQPETVVKQIWGSEDDATIARKQEQWALNRKIQERDASRRLRAKHLAMAAVALYLFRRVAHSLGFSARKVGLSLFFATIAKGLWDFRAPQRTFPGNDYRNWPILGQIGIPFDALPAGLAGFQIARAKINNFSTDEVVMFGNVRDMGLMDPRDREYMLKTNWKNYVKNGPGGGGSFQENFCEIMGRGIFAVDGEEWQDHRKVASHLFSANGLKSKMEKSFTEHGAKVVELLKPKMESKEVIDFQDAMANLTFETICDIAFGVDPGAMDVGMKTGQKLDFLVRFDRVQQLSTIRFMIPGPVWKLMRFLNIGSERQLREDAAELSKYVMDIVRKRKASGEFEPSDDLLSMYVRTAVASGKKYMMDDNYLFDAILNFMIAGRDTTSCTLTNLFKLLPTNPEVEGKMLKELDQVVGKGNAVTWDHIRELRYCGAVMNEVLRLYPPVSGDSRVAVEDDIMPSGLRIFSGQRVSILNSAIGRDPHLWENPDDFMPDRWLQEGKPTRRPDEYVFPVFWGGPRLCLGKDMARLEVVSIAYAILSHYKVNVLPHAEKMVNGPVQFYEKGLPVQIVPRD